MQQETTVSGAMPGHYRGNSATGDNSVKSYAGTLQRKQCNRRQQCQELCRDTTEETVQQETTVSGAMPGHYRGNSATGDNSVKSYAGTLQRKQCNRRQQCQELCQDTIYRGNSATGDNSVRSYARTLQRKQCNRRQQCQELCRDTTEETVQQETTGDNSVRSYARTLQRKQCNRRQQCQELCRDTTEETVRQETTVSRLLDQMTIARAPNGKN